MLDLEDAAGKALLGDVLLFRRFGLRRGLRRRGLGENERQQESNRRSVAERLHETSSFRLAGRVAGAASPFLTSQMMRTSGFAVVNSIRTTLDSASRPEGRTG